MANQIVRWNPARELASMQSMMDRLFDENWNALLSDFRTGGGLALDVHEDDNSYIVSTELPGVQPENINVRIEGDVLYIDGEIPEQVIENKNARQLMKERRYGRFSRTLRLPSYVDFDNAEADYKDGVLTLTLPKSAEARPRVIPVKTKELLSDKN